MPRPEQRRPPLRLLRPLESSQASRPWTGAMTIWALPSAETTTAVGPTRHPVPPPVIGAVATTIGIAVARVGEPERPPVRRAGAGAQRPHHKQVRLLRGAAKRVQNPTAGAVTPVLLQHPPPRPPLRPAPTTAAGPIRALKTVGVEVPELVVKVPRPKSNRTDGWAVGEDTTPGLGPVRPVPRVRAG